MPVHDEHVDVVEDRMHQQNLSDAEYVSRGIREDLIDKITETDLNEASKSMLQNLITKDLVLANFKEAEVNEMRWKLRAKQKLFFAMHPDHQCLVTGEDRAAIYDDPNANLKPLSDEERAIVRDLFDILETRITRARGMKQQELMNTRISESRAKHRRGEEESKGGLRGLLSR